MSFRAPKRELFKVNSQWHWSLLSSNGTTIAESAGGYASRTSAARAFKRMVDATRRALPAMNFHIVVQSNGDFVVVRD